MGRVPATANRLSVYSRTRFWCPTIITRDGRAASGEKMIYFDVRMFVAVKPASPNPNPAATPVRATLARTYTG